MSYTLDFPIQYIANPDRFATIGLGKLYIGVVDGDPAFEPDDRIQVYIARQNDTDLAIPQPINLTAGGVPTYLGSPVTLKINQEYSCAVLDKNNQQVYYSPKTGEVIAALNDIYNQIANLDADEFIRIASASDFILTPAVEGKVYYLYEYQAGGMVGGGIFTGESGSPVIDNGDTFSSSTVGSYFKRQDPQKTPYEFGYLDGDVDVSFAANACTSAYGECYLDAGKTYNSQYAINAKKLWCSGGVATINATSPTANDRFGSNNAVVVASGALNNPLEGVDVRNLIIDCNQLKYANNAAYLKGTIFYRLKNFYQSGCTVLGCGSYAYWDWDDVGGTTFCSGTRDDCWAIDAGVSFEQVNVRGVTLNNCHAYRSTATLAYQGNVECQFHAYGGSDMQAVYNNCTGVADGYVPAIFLALLECKNITANDCQFINNAVLSGQVSAAVFFSNDSGNYDNFTFNNCILKSVNSVAVILDRGALGSTSARFKFTGCRINGETVGVQFSNTGGVYSFTDCETTGATVGASTPFAYYNNGSSNRIQITRGSATATGSAAVVATNLDSSVFVSTVLIPSGQQLPVIRQRVVSQVVLSVGDSTYARGSLNFPNSVLGWTSPSVDTSKVVVNAYINGPKSGLGTFPDQTSVARGYSAYMASNQTVYIFFEDPANTLGKTAMVEITEYL